MATTFGAATANLGLFSKLFTLTTVLFALWPPAARGQDNPFDASTARDTIIVNGQPPLTESMVDLYTNFDRWVMEIPSFPQHRQMVRSILLRDWKNAADIQRDLTFLAHATRIVQQSAEDRRFSRCQLQPVRVEMMRIAKDPYSQWLIAAYDRAHPPIAPGNPPLTASMVARYISFMGWLLEIPLDRSRADGIIFMQLMETLNETLLADWKNPREMKNDLDTLTWQLEMAQHSPEERAYLRIITQPELIKGLQAAKGERYAQLLLAAYEEAHPRVAVGNPPLTRQAVDALTEFLCFTQNEGGGPRLNCDQALKDGYAQQFAQKYGTLSAEQQKRLADMPRTWALLRVAWAKGSEAERQNMRRQWQSPSPTGSPDRRAEEADAAAARYEAFRKRDPNTVTDQELLQVAQDCDTVAREQRRQGGAQNLKYALTWDHSASLLRAGRAVWAQDIAQDQALHQVLATMQMQNQQRLNRQLQNSLNTINMNDNINMKNAAEHVNDSLYHYENRQGQVVRVPNH